MIGLYYYGEATMKQIGAEIGVNESRVSQLHARAIRGCAMRSARCCRRGGSGQGDAQRDPRVPEAEDGEGHAEQRMGGERRNAGSRVVVVTTPASRGRCATSRRAGTA